MNLFQFFKVNTRQKVILCWKWKLYGCDVSFKTIRTFSLHDMPKKCRIGLYCTDFLCFSTHSTYGLIIIIAARVENWKSSEEKVKIKETHILSVYHFSSKVIVLFCCKDELQMR